MLWRFSGITLALLSSLYDADAGDLEWLVVRVFIFAPLVLAGIGGYELVTRTLNKE